MAKYNGIKKNSPPILMYSKRRNLKILSFLTLSNLTFWLLSINGIGYDFVRSLTGQGRFSDFTLSIFYNPVFFSPELLTREPPFDYAMTPALAVFYRLIDPKDWANTLIFLNIVSIVAFTSVIRKLVTVDKFYFLLLINCFPIFFCLMRGGADLWLLVISSKILLELKKKKKYSPGLLLGLLVAFKPQFAVFGLAFLLRRDFRAVFVTFASFIACFMGSLLILGKYTVAQQLNVVAGLSRNYQNTYAVGDGGLMWDNGFVGFQKILFYSLFQPNNQEALNFGRLAIIIQTTIGVLLLLPVFYLVSRKKIDLVEAWLLSTLMLIFLSPVSASYRLVFFIPLLIIYFYTVRSNLITSLLMLLMVPKCIIWVKTSNGHEFVGDSLINPLILISIYSVFLYTRLFRKKLELSTS